MLTQAEVTQREEALKLQQQQQNREAALRLAELAHLCASPAFQRVMLGKEGYLTGIISDAEKALLDEKTTPLNDPTKMAVHLARWRDARALHTEWKAIGTAPATATV